MPTRHPSVSRPPFHFAPPGEAGAARHHKAVPHAPALTPGVRRSPPIDAAEDESEDGFRQRLSALGWETLPQTGDYVWRRTHQGEDIAPRPARPVPAEQ